MPKMNTGIKSLKHLRGVGQSTPYDYGILPQQTFLYYFFKNKQNE